MPESLVTKKHYIKQVTIVGMIVNIALSVIKLLIGFIGNSQALIADGIHSFSDLTTDFSIFFGVKFWLRPADKDHPYGHQKIELLVTIFIAFVLMIIGLSILFKAIFSLNSAVKETPQLIAFVVAVISIISKELFINLIDSRIERLI